MADFYAIYPAQAGGNPGTVTSIDVSGGVSGLVFTGGPITSSGVITITSGTLAVTYGGTGTSTQFTPGSVVFAGTSGVYSQDNANFFWDDTNNRLGLLTTTPASTLSVGAGSLFQVNSTGNIVKINNVTTSFPASQGAASTILTNNGSGALTWSPPATSGTVTSIDVSGGTTGLTFSGGPITSSGTITMAGTLGIANGGTGQVTTAAAFAALSPLSVVGDLIYEGVGPAPARLPIGSNTDILTIAAGVPAWGATGNLTDVGTDGIVVTSGTGAVIGAGTSIAQHVADSTHNGYLSSTDWSTFNNKQAALTIGNLTDVGTDGIVITSGTGAVIGTGTSIAQHVADSTHNGYLSSTDWSTFNGKQAAGNYITALTGDVAASGPGSVAATLATVNGDVGTFGDATHVGQFTVNGKGLITAVTSVAVTAGLSGELQTTTGGGTTTLTTSNSQTQTFTSLTSAQTVKLPTTGVTAGDFWVINNTQPYTLTIQSSGANTIVTNWGSRTILQALVSTPTTAGNWAVLETAVIYGRIWAAYTPTFTGLGTVTVQTFAWMRSGPNLLMKGEFTIQATSGIAPAEISLPAPGAGINIQTTNLATNKSSFGDWHQLGNAGGVFINAIGGICFWSGGGTQVVRFAFQNATTAYSVDTSNGFLNAGFNCDVGPLTIPIDEWKEA